ncbi:MAG: hypothetical protein ACPL06_00805 [Candidatus Anstonellales archaeon]
MRARVVALILVILLFAGCIQVGGNCKGRPECYKKAAVYYGMMGDKKAALGWCRKIINDADISVIMQDLEYNNCIIEVAKTLGDENICSNVEEYYNLPQVLPISNVKEVCIKMVEQEKIRQNAMLDKSQAYKHTCPAAMLIFSILLLILLMKIYEK